MRKELEKRLREKFSAAEAGPPTAEDIKLTEVVWAGLTGIISEPDMPVASPFCPDNTGFRTTPERI